MAKRPMKIGDATLAILTETDNPGVGWGDTGLLDTIWKRSGRSLDIHPLTRHKRILDALGHDPRFEKRFTRHHPQPVRVFYPAEQAGKERKDAQTNPT